MAHKREIERNIAFNERFFELYDSMIGDVEIPNVLRDVADVVCRELDARRTSIYLIDPETQELQAAAMVGNITRTVRIPICKNSLAGFCALTGRAFVVEDAYGELGDIDPELKFDSRWDRINGFRTRDVICAPATFKGQIRGVVQAVNSRGNPFSADDLPALKTISRLIGYALYHARLYDDLASMKQLEKEKAKFMRVMVHELKSPVSATKMMIYALGEVQHEPDRVEEFTAKIAARMDQMTELISDMLQLARVKAGDPLGQISVLDIAAETHAACRPYLEQAQAKGLVLKTALPDEELHVRFDSQGYALVVSNLLSNAIKYSSEGTIDVTLRGNGRWAVLEVADNGMGIPEADIPKLFTEFFRASNAREGHIPGTGVGLAGAKDIVERFGGKFELQSRENEGSTFTVRLPIHIQ
ncbi:MAG: GAF domain-containing sensor histidine kinase [Phycisphaerae bacterium]|jgi:signal transduction histidine kinase|nr:GAF domain-containing sensor histidine kinase [Phycisphaerae bacterium]